MLPLPDLEEETSSKPKYDETRMSDLMFQLQNAITRTDEDEDQVELTDIIQHNRAFILNYAMQAYLNKPTNPKLLESVISLIAGVEKSVRDDRKEKAKKKEREDNAATFNQLLEAMHDISSGKIPLPTFDLSSFILDPSKSLVSNNDDIDPIHPGELVQGMQTLDIDGNPV